MRVTEPYRIFFPFGLLFGLLGVGFWLLVGMGSDLASLLKVAHADLMMGGFLLAFSIGFLMTAVPKFSGTNAAQPVEISSMFVATLALLISVGFGSAFFYLFALIQVLILVVFAARRIPKRTRALPTNFVFVPLGLLCALIGSFLLLCDQFELFQEARGFAKLLFHYGLMHCLVLGAGSLLIPAILGFGPLPLSSVALKEWTWGKIKVPYVLAVFLLLSFAVESFVDTTLGRGVRFGVVAFVALVCWRIFSLPKVKSISAGFIWASAWAIFAGNFLAFVAPERAVSAIHLTFVGGFSLLTLTVATRVVLAHGGHGLEAEKTSRALLLSGASVLVASLLRVGVEVFPTHSVSLLTSAAFVWVLGFVLWASRFLRLALAASK